MKTIYKLCLIISFSLALNTANSQIPQLIPFASGIVRPICITNAGDSRLFFADQHGIINILDTDGNLYPEPFLDIHNRVVYGGERGLLGLAFHPLYKTNGYFYVNYVGDGDSTHISRFSVTPGNQNIADPQSEFKLLTIYQPYDNHNGGDLCFGPDDYLYIGLGDGGLGGDPGNRAQNPMEFLGKILRIDVDHGNPYAIPVTNPFYNSTTKLEEIWALGLRNPWRFSFDRLTGDLWIADVGQEVIEEINFQPANKPGGDNYGWRCYEGNQAYNTDGCAQASTFTYPVYTYQHNDDCSVTGGYVYRGSTSSAYYGYYFFADFCSGNIWTLHNASGNWEKNNFGSFPGKNFSAFGENIDGQLYIADITNGAIYRINELSTGINPNDKLTEIKIRHVPFSNIISIETGRNNQTETSLSIHDLRGIKLYQSIWNENSFEFTLSPMPAGIYYLIFEIEGKRYTRKLILGK